ncbi:GSCOCG00012428001-RA-CDS [Cotesia congregata]|nr:GSCOCG00012428001-RA-CDS [Cotesia congregata]
MPRSSKERLGIQDDNQAANQSCSKINQREKDLDYLFNPDTISQNLREMSVLMEMMMTDLTEISNYETEAVIPKTDNPPSLARLAKKYLCIPSRSTPSERVLSTAGNVISAKRSCLSPHAANILIFLYKNRSIILKNKKLSFSNINIHNK